jgi:hypothetical protein
MNAVSKVFRRARDAISASSRSGSNNQVLTEEHDPQLSSLAVAQELSEGLESDEAEIAEIDREIDKARQDLASAEEKERFLGVRIYKYRSELHDRQLAMMERVPELQKAEDEEDLLDEENQEEDWEARLAADRQRLCEKWERDNNALETVVERHRDILMHCEIIRRTLKELESKRKAIDKMQYERTMYAGDNQVDSDEYLVASETEFGRAAIPSQLD